MDITVTIPKEIEGDLTLLADKTPLEEYLVSLISNYLINKAQESQAFQKTEAISFLTALPLETQISLMESVKNTVIIEEPLPQPIEVTK